MRNAIRADALLIFLLIVIFATFLAGGGPKGCEEKLKRSQPPLPTALVTKVGVPARYKGHEILVEKIETISHFGGSQHRVYLRVDGKPMLLDPGGTFYGLGLWVNRSFAFYFDSSGSTKLVLNKVSEDFTELEWAEVPAGWSEESAVEKAR